MRIALGRQSLGGVRRLVWRAIQLLRHVAHVPKISTRRPFRTSTANKFDAPVLPHLTAPPHQHEPDLPSRTHVRAAARLQVGAGNLDHPQNPFALHLFAHAHFRKLLLGGITHGDRAILENNRIGRALRAFQNFVGRFRPPQINRAKIFAQVKRKRG